MHITSHFSGSKNVACFAANAIKANLAPCCISINYRYGILCRWSFQVLFCFIQVMGQALFPGAGLFEMAASAGRYLGTASSAADPMLTQALISSPCQIGINSGSHELHCIIDNRWDSVCGDKKLRDAGLIFVPLKCTSTISAIM